MDQHPIPRQITTFEFKLVGFMTLKQFIYLVIFFPLAYIIFRLFPVPFLNLLLAAATAGFGVLLAFVPVNDRPLDVYLKNLLNRLISPTQYYYHKINEPVYFLEDQRGFANRQTISTYIESQQKLTQYLSRKKTSQVEKQDEVRKQQINSILYAPTTPTHTGLATAVPSIPHVETEEKTPFMVGVVKSKKQTPLPGVLLYIKDQKNTPVRLLKTNPHGVFASYSMLPPGEYTVEIKDPKEHFLFDTMRIHLEGINSKPLEFFSKELM